MEFTSGTYAQWSVLFWGLYILLSSVRTLIYREINPIPEIAWSWIAIFLGTGFMILPYFWTAHIWWKGEFLNLAGILIAIFDLRFYYRFPNISNRYRNLRSRIAFGLGCVLIIVAWIIRT